ncbi:MAG: carbamate kinase [Pseudomonadota bacterium]
MSHRQAAPALLVALGGNALIKKGQAGTITEQFANLAEPIAQIARLSRERRVLITHGNGPQVGNLLLQQECRQDLPRLPLEILVAQTQGQIGYMIESSLDNQFMALGLEAWQPLVSLISYVVVDRDDPAFQNPDKPIGPVLSDQQAAVAPYPVLRTAKGWRRVVASPRPLSIVEKREIKRLLDMDFIVICCGGGGIPVIREGRRFAGVDAVIDKDLASARLGLDVGVQDFCMATDVPGAALDFGRPGQRFLEDLSLAQARSLLAAGQFHPGSMEPKVRAALEFLEGGGRRALICSTGEIEAALAGRAGTRFHKD